MELGTTAEPVQCSILKAELTECGTRCHKLLISCFYGLALQGFLLQVSYYTDWIVEMIQKKSMEMTEGEKISPLFRKKIDIKIDPRTAFIPQWRLKQLKSEAKSESKSAESAQTQTGSLPHHLLVSKWVGDPDQLRPVPWLKQSRWIVSILNHKQPLHSWHDNTKTVHIKIPLRKVIYGHWR